MPPKSKIDSWKAAAVHDVTLPSGTEVKIRVPNLPTLVKTGQLPNALVADALQAITEGKLSPEVIAQQSEFYEALIPLTVVEPKVEAADVIELPFEDVELISEIATRQRDVDALGRHLAGLHTNKEWRKFRGLIDFDEDVEDS